MRRALLSDLVAISIANKKLHAAKCAACGTKIYPSSLMKTHLAPHQLRQKSLITEIRELQHAIERIRIA